MPIVVTSTGSCTTPSAAVTIPSRPYVRVSTGNRVVTANLLKPTPLSSTSLRHKSEIITTSSSGGHTASQNTTIIPQLRSSTLKMQQNQIGLQHSLSPAIAPAAANATLNEGIRRESDQKKDSGLESGEVSDDSHDGRANGIGGGDEGYSKLPSYLTTVGVSNCSDSRSVSAIDDTGCYDRLPAYIRGVGSRANSVEKQGVGTSPSKQPVIVDVENRMNNTYSREKGRARGVFSQNFGYFWPKGLC